VVTLGESTFHVVVSSLYKTFILSGANPVKVKALDNVSFNVSKGETFTLLGPSGCGKTTLLRCIAGLERPDSGEIMIDGKVVYSDKCFVPPDKRDVGMVFQSYAIWPHMNVFDNIAYPLKVRGYPKDRIKETVLKIISLMKLEGLETRPATQLSGGQQQRVALARALVYQPNLLLLDEPLSNLDAKLREYMRIELKELLKKLRLTAIYVTHDQAEALSLSDRIAVMNQGKILEIGKPRDIYEKPKSKFTAEFIGAINLIPGKTIKEENREGVETPIGYLECKIHGFKGSENVIVMIRPEDINLYPSFDVAARDVNVVEGRVVLTMFTGQFTDCRVEAGPLLLRVFISRRSTVVEGQKVYLGLKPDFLTVLKL